MSLPKLQVCLKSHTSVLLHSLIHCALSACALRSVWKCSTVLFMHWWRSRSGAITLTCKQTLVSDAMYSPALVRLLWAKGADLVNISCVQYSYDWYVPHATPLLGSRIHSRLWPAHKKPEHRFNISPGHTLKGSHQVCVSGSLKL